MRKSNQQIKVFHLITRFLSWGGAEKNTTLSLKALVEEGYDVFLGVGVENQSKLLDEVEKEGVKVHKFQHLQNSIKPWKDFQAILEIYHFLRSNQFDIIHTHQTKAGMLGRLAAFFARVPIIIYGIHGSTFSGLEEPLRTFLLALEKLNSLFTDSFVSVGKDLRSRFLEKNIGSEDEYFVIRSAMNLAPFFKAAKMGSQKRKSKRRELGVNENEVAVGKVASLEPRKGHKYALEVIELVSRVHSNVKFLFVGEGKREYKDKLKNVAAKKGLEDKVVFTGYREDIAKVLGALDIFFFTSLREGLPQVLVQAVASGLPVATFNVEGAREVVEDGVNGYIVPLEDTKALADRLNAMLENIEEAKEMGLKGQKNFMEIKEEWNPNKMKINTKKLYKGLLKEKNFF